jgi:hypothetical protein
LRRALVAGTPVRGPAGVFPVFNVRPPSSNESGWELLYVVPFDLKVGPPLVPLPILPLCGRVLKCVGKLRAFTEISIFA